MERISKDRVLRLWSIIAFRNGKSKYRKDFPNLALHPETNNGKTIGEYYISKNTINIWWKPHSDFKELASTLLHEYAHYLQFWPWYSRYEKIYSYDKNPYEIQANQFETKAPDVIREISEENWKSLIKKNPKLRKLYEQAEEKIEIN